MAQQESVGDVGVGGDLGLEGGVNWFFVGGIIAAVLLPILYVIWESGRTNK